MIDAVTTILASGPTGKPVFESEAITAFKELINALSVPELSLPFFFMPLFILMIVAYRYWTKPLPALILLGVFCFAYFGSMLIDVNYKAIIMKPDNVPITLMLLGTGICLWLAFRQAAINDDNVAAGRPLIEEDRDDKVLVWPDLVYTELICLVIAAAGLVLWAVALPAPLESPANPAGPPNPSKAPWYFLGLQEMLVYFDPWMAGVLLPGMIVTGLIAMPYMDTNPRGNGYYTLKQRPFAITSWLFGFIILWIVLIVFGTFLRGPNWNFFGPYQYWDSHLQVPLTNVNLSDYFWLWGLNEPLPANPFVREAIGIVLVGGWCFGLPVLLAKPPMFLRKLPLVGNFFDMFAKLYDSMGFIRFVVLSAHLVIMAMLPLKMLLRWLVHLKYFIYLPEFNLNL